MNIDRFYPINDDNMNEFELDVLINELENAPMLLVSTPEENVHCFDYWSAMEYIERHEPRYYCITAI